MADKAEDILEELRSVKTLLMLHLLTRGVKQNQIASALGVHEATVSRMLPKGLSRSLAKNADVAGRETS